LPLGDETSDDTDFEHPEFAVIKEQMTKTKIEDPPNRISEPFVLRQLVGQV
jgi:hypothetical protein